MSYMEQFNFWVEDSYFDDETKKELLAIKDNEKEIFFIVLSAYNMKCVYPNLHRI